MAIALLAACSGDDDGTEGAGTQSVSTQPADTEDGGSAMRLTLTDDGCTYEGAETVPAAPFTVEAENQSSTDGAFTIGGIGEGSTIAELEAYMKEEQQRWDETQELLGPPAFYTQVTRVGVAAAESSLLPVDGDAGTYALTCFNDAPPTWRAYVAAELDVTG